MIFIQRTAEPTVLQTQGKAQQQLVCAAYDSGEREFKFDSSLYGHAQVKSALIAMQHEKCCFCESKITHISYGDVEHYRPKGGYQQSAQDPLQNPGYYWLAYDWENLLLSCTLCNQRHKKNLFPLVDPQQRATTHHDSIAQEQPLFINPSVTNPSTFIGFRQEIPYAIDGNAFGKMTIEALGLNREALNEKRREKWKEIALLIDIINLAAVQPDNQGLQTIASQAKLRIADAKTSTAEYSVMIASQVP